MSRETLMNSPFGTNSLRAAMTTDRSGAVFHHVYTDKLSEYIRCHTGLSSQEAGSITLAVSDHNSDEDAYEGRDPGVYAEDFYHDQRKTSNLALPRQLREDHE